MRRLRKFAGLLLLRGRTWELGARIYGVQPGLPPGVRESKGEAEEEAK